MCQNNIFYKTSAMNAFTVEGVKIDGFYRKSF